MAALAPSEAQAAPSLGCPAPITFTVASGGSHQIDASSCDPTGLPAPVATYDKAILTAFERPLTLAQLPWAWSGERKQGVYSVEELGIFLAWT